MKSNQILYCGDCRMDDAAKYLAGAMKWCGYQFDYVESDQRIKPNTNLSKYRLFIISDYPSKRWSAKHLKAIHDKVYSGAALWMIGGWGSYKGVDGDYHRTSLADVLPVKIRSTDDRVQGAVAYRLAGAGQKIGSKKLEFQNAPMIAGFNRVTLKKDAQLLAKVQTLITSKNQTLSISREDPLLVFGRYGTGNVLSYMSDLAPHWSGGLVDWGSKRIQISIQRKVGIQVADQYLKFIAGMLEILMPNDPPISRVKKIS